MEWADRAAKRIIHDFEKIEAECGQVAQAEQDPEPAEYLMTLRIAAIIKSEFRKCSDCGGTGHRFYALSGEGSCLTCKGTGRR